MTTLTFDDILRDLQIGIMQSAGVMQVIPLITTRTDEDDVELPSGLGSYTSSYGTMHWKNKGRRVAIVPMHAAALTKAKAQDHGMAQAGIVSPGTDQHYEDSLCVQQTQGGLVSEQDGYQLVILPQRIRAQVAGNSNTSYSRAWDVITSTSQTIGRTLGENRAFRGNVVDMLTQFETQLARFVAEFEPVPNQVGAFILIGGQVVGVEIAPTCAYWMDIWRTIIRDTYGTRALEWEKREIPETRSRMRQPESLDDLVQAVMDADDADRRSVQGMIEQLHEEKFEVAEPRRPDHYRNLRLHTVANPKMVGNVVVEGVTPRVRYASLVSRN